MPAITTSNKVLVDLAFILPVTGKEKIIFSRSGKTSLWFDFKKIFWGKRMEEEAAKRIKNIFNNYSEIDRTFINPFQSIKDEEGIDENAVIEAFADLEKRKKLKLPTQDLLAELENAKTIIDEKLKNSDSVALNKDILLLAQNKCTPPFNPNIIKKSLGHLDKIDKNDLNRIKYDDCSNILSILNHLKEEILVNPDDTYIKKVSAQIDRHIELLTPHQARLEEDLLNKEACNKRLNTLQVISRNLNGWIKTIVDSKELNSHLKTLDDSSKLSKLKNKQKTISEVSQLSINNLYPKEDIFEFILLLEDPSHAEIKIDEVSKLKLENFISFVYTALPKFKRKQQIDAPNAVDYLRGILQSQDSTDIRSPSSTSFVKKNIALLHALNKNWKQCGPSGFSMDLLRYFELGKSTINSESEWNLSFLISIDGRIDQIKNNLPPELHAEFESKIEKLKDDLKNFESDTNTKPKTNSLFLTETSPTPKVITSIISALENFSVFEESDGNKMALNSFINFLNRTNDFSFNKNNKRDLDQFFVIFFDNIKTLTPDQRMLCLKEVDVLEGMLLQYENNGIDAIDISTIKNNSTFDLATGIQFLAHTLPLSANLSHLINYLKDGKSSINVINYWGLQYFCQSQFTQLKDSLHEPLRTHFQTQIEQLRKDLVELKPIYQARTTQNI